MLLFIFIFTFYLGYCTRELRDEMGAFAWSQWLLVFSVFVYMILTFIGF
jgi:hypothetical protein